VPGGGKFNLKKPPLFYVETVQSEELGYINLAIQPVGRRENEGREIIPPAWVTKGIDGSLS